MISPTFVAFRVLAGWGFPAGTDGLIRACLSKDKGTSESAVRTLIELGVSNHSVELEIFQAFMQNSVPDMSNTLACIMGSIFTEKHARGMETQLTASRLMRMIRKSWP